MVTMEKISDATRKNLSRLEKETRKILEDVRQSDRVARDRLAEIEATYSAAPIGLCVLDRDLRFVRVNQRLAEINGASVTVHLGKTIREILPHMADEVEPLLKKILESGEPMINVEICSETAARPGIRRNWLGSWVPLHNAEGETIGINMMVQDITERKRLESKLRVLNRTLEERVARRTLDLTVTVKELEEEVARRQQAEENVKRQSSMLEAFFAHTINPVAFMDPDFNFIRVNEAYAKVEGKSPEDYFGRNYFELYPNSENQKIFREVVRTKNAFQGYTKTFSYPEHPERSNTYWDWALTPLLDKSGEIAYLVLNLENVTGRQEVMEKLELRARQLQQLAMELSQAEDRERQRMAEVLHDDLQQLLVAAKLRLEMLCSKKQHDSQCDHEVDRIIGLLAQSIARSRSLSHELSPPILSGSGIEKAFEWLAAEMNEKYSLNVFIDAKLQNDCESKALQAFAYRAVQEMLFNVVKHANIDKAQVRLRSYGDQLCIMVADKGKGFCREQFRVAGGSKGGFGLFSIRERVQYLGGRFKVFTMPGKGSCVAFSIPLGSSVFLSGHSGEKSEQYENNDFEKQAAESMLERRLKVMLVDDHKIMRDGLLSILSEEPDLEIVAEASNGREAVTLASRLVPDVIIMDVSMPIMDGIEATRQIKSINPRIRIVGLSMFDDSSMSERMKEAGADKYLCKTGPPGELLAAIRFGL